MSTFMHKIPVKRICKIAVFAIFAGVLLLSVTLASLPTLINSHTVQNRIQKALSSSMKRQVAWSNLVMTWPAGLTLSGFTFGDGPAPLLRAEIDRITIVPGFGRGTDGGFGIDLTIRIHTVRADLAPGPAKPPSPKPAKDPLTLLAETIQKVQKLDVPLPVDLRVMVEVAPMQVTYHAPPPGKQLQLRDFSLRFAMPSLAARPVTAEVNGRVSANGHDVGNVTFNAKVSDLVTKTSRVHLASALFSVDTTAPGTSMTLTGGLSQSEGFAARVKLDLPGFQAIAGPFIPPTVPKLEGNFELLLRAKSDANRDLHASLTIDGSGLAARGGSLKAKKVGPLDLKLRQLIATDHTRQRVDFSSGTLSIPGLLDAAWNASVTRPTSPERALEIRFGPLRLDLARVFSLSAPFIPATVPVTDIAGEASLRSLILHLNGPGNHGTLAVNGFGIIIPRVRLALVKGDLTAENTELTLDMAECPLSATVPTRLTADLLWSIGKTRLSGVEPLTVLGMRGKVGVALSDLNLKGASPRRVSASAVMTQTLDLDRASLGIRLTAENVHEQLRILARAADNGEITADLPEFAVTVDSLHGTQSGRRIAPFPLAASLTATDLHITTVKGVRPTLKHAAAVISAGDFLRFTADAALSGASPQRATSSGTARIDLHRALPYAAPFAPKGLKADGVVTAVWDMAGPLPEKALSAEKHPLRNARTVLSLFDTLEFGLKLDTISASVPSARGTITVTGLRTGPELHFVTARKGESARFDGGLLFAGVNGLPGAAGKLPVQHGSFVFNGELSGWREFRLSEALRIDPLALSHEAELNVSRIDALLEEKEPFNTVTLLKRLDATLIAGFDGKFSRGMKQLLPGFDVAGTVSSAVRVDLSAAHELALRCSLSTKDFDVQIANGTKVEGLSSDIAVNRVYSLAASTGERWTPLSTALIRPAAVVPENPGAAEIIGRIHDDLRGDMNGARSFTIRRVTTKASGVPLVITALEGDLLFTREMSGLSFFQADLLGGTLLARGLFDLRPEVPNITAAGSFSHLDITYLLPAENRKRQGDQDAEITGEMSLTAPLTAEQRELFEQLRLALNVRKIGSNTIERALFSLDPYERNEQVVAQRKMLRLGGLKGLRATAVDGAFSMEGEAYIKGVTVDLPKVERLRISELPLRRELVKNRSAIKTLRGVLDLVRADSIVVGPKGELSLKRRKYAQ